MLIRIGELLNELMKYSSKIESMVVGSTPVLNAFLSKDNFTRVYLYVAQVDDKRYTACSDIFDSLGSRFVPTGRPDNPFIRDLDKTHNYFDGSLSVTERYTTRVKNIGYPDMIDYIHSILRQYGIVDTNKNILNTRISSFGFGNSKIVHSLQNAFVENGMFADGTINDIFNIVIKNQKKFNMNGLKAKDIKVVRDKLSDRGIQACVVDSSIVDLTFKRR